MKYVLPKVFAAVALAIAMPAAPAATVTVSESTASAATLAFADHVGARLGLYMACDSEDRGASTNGWASVEYLGTVAPDADSLSVALPTGWGTEGKTAARFFLSEVPYPVDYTLDYIQSNGSQYMEPSPGNTPTGAAVVEMDVELTSVSGTVTLFCARGGTSGASAKQFTLLVNGGYWRFDYNAQTGAAAGLQNTSVKPSADVRYAIRVSSDGFYIGDDKIQDRPSTVFSTECGGRLLIMALASGAASPSSTSANKMKLYGFKLADSQFSLDLVPAVKGGVVGCYDTASGNFIASATSTAFAAGPRQQSVETAANPFVSASAVLEAAAATEILFSNETALTDATDYDTALPARKIGAGVLTLSGDTSFGGFDIDGGTVLFPEGASYASASGVNVGRSTVAGSAGSLIVSNAMFDVGSAIVSANAASGKLDSDVRVIVYGDDSVVRVGRISVSKGEAQIWGGDVTAVIDGDSVQYGIALGSGTQACRLYGGTIMTQCVRFSGTAAAFEWRGGTFKAYADVTGRFFQPSGAFSGDFDSATLKTRVYKAGGAFDTNGHIVRINKALVPGNGSGESTAVAYDRATSMTVPAFRKIGDGTLVFAAANTYLCATEVAAGTLRLETAALPTAGLLRLTGGTLAFHNNETAISQTVGNVVGTGTITDTRSGNFSHALAVTGEIVPGGPDGSLGPITVNGVALTGAVALRVDSSGAIPSNIVNADSAALDVSGLSFTIEDAANLPRDQSRVYLVQGPVTGTPSVSGLPEGWIVRAGSDGLTARAGGFVMVVR